MKNILFLTIAIFTSGLVFAQAVSGRVDYQKSQQPAAIIELPYSAETTEAAIKDFLAKKGAKPGTAKGFLVFRKVQLALSDPTPSDVYFKIDKRSKKDNNNAVVYMMVAKPDENVATRSSEDNSGIDQAISFLNEIGPSIGGYSLDVDMRAQEENIKKAEKRYNTLMDEARDLENRRRAIEEKLQDNLREQERQKAEIDKQRQILQSINSKKNA
ncbi:MAG TPA: hypothetical protein VEZ17_08665 [Chitinophagaceae bacterium]|jgi:hypothetical protein|nr:hypothetical protein [Chitinophagaceae bacterium]